MTHLKPLLHTAAAAAIALLMAFGSPASAQYTYGAPDYNYDRGWYGTNNWYDTYNHYGYIYSSPYTYNYRYPGTYYGLEGGDFSQFGGPYIFDDYDAQGVFGGR